MKRISSLEWDSSLDIFSLGYHTYNYDEKRVTESDSRIQTWRFCPCSAYLALVCHILEQ